MLLTKVEEGAQPNRKDTFSVVESTEQSFTSITEIVSNKMNDVQLLTDATFIEEGSITIVG